MPSQSSKKPFSWEDYEYGRSSRQGSEGSLGSRVLFDAPSPTATSSQMNIPGTENRNAESNITLRRQRSSLSMRINSLAQAGGPNSLENFARSWSRAAAFVEISPPQPSCVVSEQGEENHVGPVPSGERPPLAQSKSLLRQQLDRHGTSSSAIVDDEDAASQELDEEVIHKPEDAKSTSEESIQAYDRAPLLGPPFSSSYGGIYGSPSSIATSTHHAGGLYQEHQAKGRHQSNKDQQRLLVKAVQQKDGKRTQVVIGQSTLPQTIFNSVNVLIGIGLLSLPLGLKYSGWLVGMLFLLFAAIVTRYTAGLLAKCMETDHTLITFSDLAWKAFGLKTRIATGLLFTVELLAACVALVVLFADSLNALVGGLGVLQWKLFCGLVLIPFSFVPLRYLSFTSVLGILSCLGIVTLIFVDGFVKPHSPGSLREPASTSMFPQRWSTLPLSFGLLMSPWGGHSVFPNIYRDMRHPRKYTKSINYTYVFTYLLDLSVAVAGFLMFGENVRDEITSNIFLTEGYPHAISVAIVIFIAIVPLTKVPLNARPIFAIAEALLNLNSHSPSPSPYTRLLLKCLVRILTIILIVTLAIVVPSFDTIMALLGSAMAFSICIILPLAFYLKLFYRDIKGWEKALDWGLIVICGGMGVVGTVWVFLPKGVREGLDG